MAARLNIDTHQLLSFSAESLLGESVAVLGIKGSGKSNTAAVIVEELLTARVPVCVLDIAGEYHGLKTEYEDIYVIGCSLNPSALDAQIRSPDKAAKAAERSYRRGVPVVLDLSGFESDHRLEFVAAYLRHIWRLAPALRHPYTIVMEEAHNYVPQRGATVVKKVATDIAAEGRKRGLGIVMIGQRSSRIDKDVLTQAGVLFLHRVIHSADLRTYAELIPRPPSQVKHSAQKLKTGEALVLSGELYRRCMIRLRHTPHYGYTPTMDDLPDERGIDDVAQLVGVQTTMQLGDEGDDNAFRRYYSE